MTNYTLNQCCKPSTPYRSPDAAMLVGQCGTQAFTVEMLTPNMIVCYWQPGMAQPAYNEYYKAWYVDQQSGYEMIAGQPAER